MPSNVCVCGGGGGGGGGKELLVYSKSQRLHRWNVGMGK